MSTNQIGEDIQHWPLKALERDRNHKNYKEAKKIEKDAISIAKTIR